MFEGKVVLLLESCFLPHCIQVGELLQVFILALQGSWLGIKLCRFQIQVVQILSSVLTVTSCVKALKLLLIRLGWKASSCERVIIPPNLPLHLIPLYLLPHLIVLIEILNHLPIHLGSISVPSVPLHLIRLTNILGYIICCDVFACKTCTYLPRPLGTFLFGMAHRSTILTCAFPVVGSLVPFFASIVPFI